MADMPNTDDNSNLVDMDDLDNFSKAFFKGEPDIEKVDVKVQPDGTAEEVEEVDETDDDTVATEDDKEADEEEKTSDEDEDKSEEEAPKGKKNRKSFQERIDELVADKRQTQRQLEVVMRQLEELQTRKPEEKHEPTLRDQLPEAAPSPDALNDKGEPIYPLGEFDPKFIKDLTKFTIAQETKAMQEKLEADSKAKAQRESQEALQKEWAEKVEKFEAENDDFREEVSKLEYAFRGVDPQYGEYLATTIMQCENGPDIMYYLSQNIGEAQNIVASGPFAATLAIGRLQEKLASPKQVEQATSQKKVSNAPNPPQEVSRGKGGQFAVRPDTDDLDAFEREFFNRKR